MAQYFIVQGNDVHGLNAFERRVNELLDDGYEIAGNFYVIERVVTSDKKVLDYYQPMLKLNEREKDERRWK